MTEKKKKISGLLFVDYFVMKLYSCLLILIGCKGLLNNFFNIQLSQNLSANSPSKLETCRLKLLILWEL